MDILLKEAIGNSVFEYQIFVNTKLEEYKCQDSEHVLCSKLEDKIQKEKEFKEAIEKSIKKHFSEKTLIFFTKKDHIRIFTNTT